MCEVRKLSNDDNIQENSCNTRQLAEILMKNLKDILPKVEENDALKAALYMDPRFTCAGTSFLSSQQILNSQVCFINFIFMKSI
jgi:hypothetical protein